jgi:hypothetical protein
LEINLLIKQIGNFPVVPVPAPSTSRVLRASIIFPVIGQQQRGSVYLICNLNSEFVFVFVFSSLVFLGAGQVFTLPLTSMCSPKQNLKTKN